MEKTIQILAKIGFSSAPNFSHNSNLVLNFPNGVLMAYQAYNRYFQEVVFIEGYLKTSRVFQEIHGQIPREVESMEECFAFLSFAIGRQSDVEMWPSWYRQGLENFHLLPHLKESAKYRNAPRAYVEYVWLKAIIKTISNAIQQVDDTEMAVWSFDGIVIKVEFLSELVVARATGTAWKEQYRVKLNDLARLPKRLRHSGDSIIILDDVLQVAGCNFPIVSNVPSVGQQSLSFS